MIIKLVNPISQPSNPSNPSKSTMKQTTPNINQSQSTVVQSSGQFLQQNNSGIGLSIMDNPALFSILINKILSRKREKKSRRRRKRRR